MPGWPWFLVVTAFHWQVDFPLRVLLPTQGVSSPALARAVPEEGVCPLLCTSPEIEIGVAAEGS